MVERTGAAPRAGYYRSVGGKRLEPRSEDLGASNVEAPKRSASGWLTAGSGRSPTSQVVHLRPQSTLAAVPVALETHTVLEPGAAARLGVVTHNEGIAALMRSGYTDRSLAAVEAELQRLGTLEIGALSTGLPQAAESVAHAKTHASGYDNVWTRDTCLIAHAWGETGEQKRAARALTALLNFYQSDEQLGRLRSGVNAAAAGDVAWAKEHERPAIKFDGTTLLSVPWGREQNDALGLFLWSTFHAARQGVISLDDAQLRPLVLVAAFLKGIDYTTDLELGHWEEGGKQGGKISTSTLRSVVAGLQEMRRWADADPARRTKLKVVYESEVGAHAHGFTDFGSGETLRSMIETGSSAIARLLPLESDGKGIYRRTADLALTTALYLDLLAEPEDRLIAPQTQMQILGSLTRELRRSHGDARYKGDGYWGAYFDPKEPGLVERLNLASLEERQEAGMKEDGEAQWTLGAPILSAIWGRLYLETGRPEYLEQQTHELNRALGMITGERSSLVPGVLPESYVQVRVSSLDDPERANWTFTENGLPLNWSKANLRLAMKAMRESVARRSTHLFKRAA